MRFWHCVGHVAFCQFLRSLVGHISSDWDRFFSNLGPTGSPKPRRCDWKLNAGILCNIFRLLQFQQAVGGHIQFDWGRSPMEQAPWNHPNSQSEVSDSDAAYCSCDGFYKSSVARSHSVAADFLLDRLHRIIQPSEDVTENLVSAYHSTHFGCILFQLALVARTRLIANIFHKIASIDNMQTYNYVTHNIDSTFYSTDFICINPYQLLLTISHLIETLSIELSHPNQWSWSG